MTTRTRSYWLLASGLCLTLAGCASDVGLLSGRAIAMAQRSRVATLTGPDKQYLALLERSIAEMKEEPAGTRDTVGLLLALDELAEIYSFRLVQFEKAAQVNTEAARIVNDLGATGPIERLGWFFNQHRGFYSVIGPFGVLSRASVRSLREGQWSQQPRSFVWAGTKGEPLRSIYPESFVRAIAERDVARAATRIQARRSLLAKLTGLSIAQPEGGTRLLHSNRVSVNPELALFEQSLSGVAEPYRSALLLERVWDLRHDSGAQQALVKVAELGARFLETETAAYRDAHTRDAILARLRIGVASLALGRVPDGIALVEDAEVLLTRHAENLQRLQQEARWRTLEGAVIGALIGPFLSQVSILGGQAMQAAFTAPGRLGQISELYRHQTGIAGILTESEQIEFYVRLGRAYETMGQPAKAIAQYRKAIEIIERQRVTIRSEAGRIFFLADKEVPYARLISMLVTNGDPTSALDVAERGRSRAFVELLAEGKVRLATAEDTRRYETMVRRNTEIDVLAQANNLSPALAEDAYRTIRDIAMHPGAPAAPVSLEFASLATVSVAKVHEISAVLGRNAALVAFFVGADETSVFLVQDGAVSAWNRPVGRHALQRRVEQIRAAVATGAASSSDAAHSAELNRLTATLYRDLLQPAFGQLTKRVVYVAPHGPLHYLPFAAIFDGRGYLIEQYTLLATPSGTVLTSLAKKHGRPPATTVVLANPDVGDRALDLPYAEREGAMIEARRTGTILFSRADATKDKLEEWAPKAGVLHLAAHARLDARRPLESAVFLAPSRGHDGRLTAGEVFSLTLPSTLVVLSACQTGLGSLASGDELIGLTRAFMYAGAPQVVATLWPISDESTAHLMGEFYDQLRTRPPAEALRLAQLHLRTRYPHPFHWAGFSIFGHSR